MSATFTCPLFAYNHERWADEAVAAIQRQTVPFDRIIVSTDGSRDRTLEVIRKAFGRDPRVEYLDHLGENRGLPKRLGEMFARLRNEYVIVASADDVLSARCVEHHRDALLRTGREWSVGSVTMCNEQLEPLETFTAKLDIEQTPGAMYRILLLKRGPDLPSHGWCYSADLYHRVGGHGVLRAVDDYPLGIRLAAAAEPAIVPDVVAYYRKVPGAMMQVQGEAVFRDMARIALGEISRAPITSLRAASSWYVGAAVAARRAGRHSRALVDVAAGIALWPSPNTLIGPAMAALRRRIRDLRARGAR
jgi:hypothetical protein